MSITSIIILITYVISVVCLYKTVVINNNLNDETNPDKLIGYFLIFMPGVNFSIVILLIFSWIDNKLNVSEKVKNKYNEIRYNMREKAIKRVERKIIREDRKEKIKLGIIRISKNDPHGEENWND